MFNFQSLYFSRVRTKALILLLMVGAIYLPFLGTPFFFDDLSFFSGNVASQFADSPPQLSLRWLPYASLAWTTSIFSDVIPHFFHLGNALLHAANVILLFFLLRQLVGAVITDHEKYATLVWGAWFGALIFAIHPVAVYAVGYVIQRSVLMATLFTLLMQFAYLRGLLTRQARWFALAVLAYFLACFSKEHSVLAPAVLLAMHQLLHGGKLIARPMLWVTWAGFVLIGIFVVLRAQGVFGTPYEVMAAALFEQQGIVESTPMLHLLSILTQAGLFFKYLLLWIVPNPAWMSVDMREPFVASWTSWRGGLGVAGFAVYGYIALRLLLKGGIKGLAGWALLYPWLQFFIEFSSIRVQEPFVLYRSYLWMPGMMLLFTLLLMKLPGRRTIFTLGCVVLLMLPLAWNRLWVFADNYRLWNDAALLLKNEKVAGADRIYYNRAQASAAMQHWEQAIADYQRVVAISPNLAPVRHAFGTAYFNSGRYQDALTQFDTAIILNADDARFYYAKGITLKRLHEDGLAMQQMEISCKMKNMMACLIVAMAQGKR